MNFDKLAQRLVRLDDFIAVLMPLDPAFVERRLIPRRVCAWRTFRSKWSPDVSSAQAWQLAQLLAKGKP